MIQALLLEGSRPGPGVGGRVEDLGASGIVPARDEHAPIRKPGCRVADALGGHVLGLDPALGITTDEGADEPDEEGGKSEARKNA